MSASTSKTRRNGVILIDEDEKQPFPPFSGDDVEKTLHSITDLEMTLAESNRHHRVVVGTDTTGHCEGGLKTPRSDVRHSFHYFNNENKGAELNHVEDAYTLSDKFGIISGLKRVASDLAELIKRLEASPGF